MLDGDEWMDGEADGLAPEFDSLDEWLAADIRGELPPGTVRSGSARFPAALRFRLADKARHLRGLWPRPCNTCGVEFRPTYDGVINCGDCRAIKRAKLHERRKTRSPVRFEARPCKGCGESFEPEFNAETTQSPKWVAFARYCDACKIAGRAPGRAPERLRKTRGAQEGQS